MNNRIAIFIDFDGTLYDNKEKFIPKSTIETLYKYHNKYDLFLSTGRAKFVLGQLEEYLPLFKGMVLMNGDYVLYNGETLIHEYFDEADIKHIVKVCEEDNIVLALPTTDECYVNDMDEFINKVLDGKDLPSIHNIEGFNFDTSLHYSMAWVFAERAKLEEMAKKVPNADIIPWGRYGGDVLIKGHSKANGIKEILNKLNYKLENTFAIGNGDNDLEMFGLVNTAIAMGNSSEKALQAANYITDDLHKDGFKKAFDYIDKVVNK